MGDRNNGNNNGNNNTQNNGNNSRNNGNSSSNNNNNPPRNLQPILPAALFQPVAPGVNPLYAHLSLQLQLQQRQLQQQQLQQQFQQQFQQQLGLQPNPSLNPFAHNQPPLGMGAAPLNIQNANLQAALRWNLGLQGFNTFQPPGFSGLPNPLILQNPCNLYGNSFVGGFSGVGLQGAAGIPSVNALSTGPQSTSGHTVAFPSSGGLSACLPGASGLQSGLSSASSLQSGPPSASNIPSGSNPLGASGVSSSGSLPTSNEASGSSQRSQTEGMPKGKLPVSGRRKEHDRSRETGPSERERQRNSSPACGSRRGTEGPRKTAPKERRRENSPTVSGCTLDTEKSLKTGPSEHRGRKENSPERSGRTLEPDVFFESRPSEQARREASPPDLTDMQSNTDRPGSPGGRSRSSSRPNPSSIPHSENRSSSLDPRPSSGSIQSSSSRFIPIAHRPSSDEPSSSNCSRPTVPYSSSGGPSVSGDHPPSGSSSSSGRPSSGNDSNAGDGRDRLHSGGKTGASISRPSSDEPSAIERPESSSSRASSTSLRPSSSGLSFSGQPCSSGHSGSDDLRPGSDDHASSSGRSTCSDLPSSSCERPSSSGRLPHTTSSRSSSGFSSESSGISASGNQSSFAGPPPSSSSLPVSSSPSTLGGLACSSGPTGNSGLLHGLPEPDTRKAEFSTSLTAEAARITTETGNFGGQDQAQLAPADQHVSRSSPVLHSVQDTGSSDQMQFPQDSNRQTHETYQRGQVDSAEPRASGTWHPFFRNLRDLPQQPQPSSTHLLQQKTSSEHIQCHQPPAGQQSSIRQQHPQSSAGQQLKHQASAAQIHQTSTGQHQTSTGQHQVFTRQLQHQAFAVQLQNQASTGKVYQTSSRLLQQYQASGGQVKHQEPVGQLHHQLNLLQKPSGQVKQYREATEQLQQHQPSTAHLQQHQPSTGDVHQASSGQQYQAFSGKLQHQASAGRQDETSVGQLQESQPPSGIQQQPQQDYPEKSTQTNTWPVQYSPISPPLPESTKGPRLPRPSQHDIVGLINLPRPVPHRLSHPRIIGIPQHSQSGTPFQSVPQHYQSGMAMQSITSESNQGHAGLQRLLDKNSGRSTLAVIPVCWSLSLTTAPVPGIVSSTATPSCESGQIRTPSSEGELIPTPDQTAISTPIQPAVLTAISTATSSHQGLNTGLSVLDYTSIPTATSSLREDVAIKMGVRSNTNNPVSRPIGLAEVSSSGPAHSVKQELTTSRESSGMSHSVIQEHSVPESSGCPSAVPSVSAGQRHTVSRDSKPYWVSGGSRNPSDPMFHHQENVLRSPGPQPLVSSQAQEHPRILQTEFHVLAAKSHPGSLPLNTIKSEPSSLLSTGPCTQKHTSPIKACDAAPILPSHFIVSGQTGKKSPRKSPAQARADSRVAVIADMARESQLKDNFVANVLAGAMSVGKMELQERPEVAIYRKILFGSPPSQSGSPHKRVSVSGTNISEQADNKRIAVTALQQFDAQSSQRNTADHTSPRQSDNHRNQPQPAEPSSSESTTFQQSDTHRPETETAEQADSSRSVAANLEWSDINRYQQQVDYYGYQATPKSPPYKEHLGTSYRSSPYKHQPLEGTPTTTATTDFVSPTRRAANDLLKNRTNITAGEIIEKIAAATSHQDSSTPKKPSVESSKSKERSEPSASTGSPCKATQRKTRSEIKVEHVLLSPDHSCPSLSSPSRQTGSPFGSPTRSSAGLAAGIVGPPQTTKVTSTKWFLNPPPQVTFTSPLHDDIHPFNPKMPATQSSGWRCRAERIDEPSQQTLDLSVKTSPEKSVQSESYNPLTNDTSGALQGAIYGKPQVSKPKSPWKHSPSKRKDPKRPNLRLFIPPREASFSELLKQKGLRSSSSSPSEDISGSVQDSLQQTVSDSSSQSGIEKSSYTDQTLSLQKAQGKSPVSLELLSARLPSTVSGSSHGTQYPTTQAVPDMSTVVWSSSLETPPQYVVSDSSSKAQGTALQNVSRMALQPQYSGQFQTDLNNPPPERAEATAQSAPVPSNAQQTQHAGQIQADFCSPRHGWPGETVQRIPSMTREILQAAQVQTGMSNSPHKMTGVPSQPVSDIVTVTDLSQGMAKPCFKYQHTQNVSSTNTHSGQNQTYSSGPPHEKASVPLQGSSRMTAKHIPQHEQTLDNMRNSPQELTGVPSQSVLGTFSVNSVGQSPTVSGSLPLAYGLHEAGSLECVRTHQEPPRTVPDTTISASPSVTLETRAKRDVNKQSTEQPRNFSGTQSSVSKWLRVYTTPEFSNIVAPPRVSQPRKRELVRRKTSPESLSNPKNIKMSSPKAGNPSTSSSEGLPKQSPKHLSGTGYIKPVSPRQSPKCPSHPINSRCLGAKSGNLSPPSELKSKQSQKDNSPIFQDLASFSSESLKRKPKRPDDYKPSSPNTGGSPAYHLKEKTKDSRKYPSLTYQRQSGNPSQAMQDVSLIAISADTHHSDLIGKEQSGNKKAQEPRTSRLDLLGSMAESMSDSKELSLPQGQPHSAADQAAKPSSSGAPSGQLSGGCSGSSVLQWSVISGPDQGQSRSSTSQAISPLYPTEPSTELSGGLGGDKWDNNVSSAQSLDPSTNTDGAENTTSNSQNGEPLPPPGTQKASVTEAQTDKLLTLPGTPARDNQHSAPDLSNSRYTPSSQVSNPDPDREMPRLSPHPSDSMIERMMRASDCVQQLVVLTKKVRNVSVFRRSGKRIAFLPALNGLSRVSAVSSVASVTAGGAQDVSVSFNYLEGYDESDEEGSIPIMNSKLSDHVADSVSVSSSNNTDRDAINQCLTELYLNLFMERRRTRGRSFANEVLPKLRQEFYDIMTEFRRVITDITDKTIPVSVNKDGEPSSSEVETVQNQSSTDQLNSTIPSTVKHSECTETRLSESENKMETDMPTETSDDAAVAAAAEVSSDNAKDNGDSDVEVRSVPANAEAFTFGPPTQLCGGPSGPSTQLCGESSDVEMVVCSIDQRTEEDAHENVENQTTNVHAGPEWTRTQLTDRSKTTDLAVITDDIFMEDFDDLLQIVIEEETEDEEKATESSSCNDEIILDLTCPDGFDEYCEESKKNTLQNDEDFDRYDVDSHSHSESQNSIFDSKDESSQQGHADIEKNTVDPQKSSVLQKSSDNEENILDSQEKSASERSFHSKDISCEKSAPEGSSGPKNLQVNILDCRKKPDAQAQSPSQGETVNSQENLDLQKPSDIQENTFDLQTFVSALAVAYFGETEGGVNNINPPSNPVPQQTERSTPPTTMSAEDFRRELQPVLDLFWHAADCHMNWRNYILSQPSYIEQRGEMERQLVEILEGFFQDCLSTPSSDVDSDSIS